MHWVLNGPQIILLANKRANFRLIIDQREFKKNKAVVVVFCNINFKTLKQKKNYKKKRK